MGLKEFNLPPLNKIEMLVDEMQLIIRSMSI